MNDKPVTTPDIEFIEQATRLAGMFREPHSHIQKLEKEIGHSVKLETLMIREISHALQCAYERGSDDNR